MGNAGKFVERARARELRAQSWTLQEIADELSVSKGSVSTWVRDVDFARRPRNRGHRSDEPHPLHTKKLAEIERCKIEAERFVGDLSDRDLEMFCLALYAGEGSKTDGAVKFANTNVTLMRIFVSWLRRSFDIEEQRLRIVLYLHADLDLPSAAAFWSAAMEIPVDQFTKPYRPAVNGTFRANRHANGCATVVYNSRLIHRRVMARIEAVVSAFAFRDSSAGRASDC